MPAPILALLVFLAFCRNSAAGVELILTDRDTGETVAGVTVRISGNSAEWEAKSDGDGRVHLKDVPPGVYRLQLEKRGFVDPKDLAGEGRIFGIARREPATRTLSLVSSGVISGRVTGENGDPLSGMLVMPVTRRGSGLASGDPVVTDDTGRFRLYRLLPGSYTVAVRPLENKATPLASAVVYYPGTHDGGRAGFLELKRGGELAGVDVVFRSGPAGSLQVAVTGVSENGTDATVAVAVVPEGALRVPVAVSLGRAGREFRFEGLAAGGYELLAWSPGSSSDWVQPPAGEGARYGMARAHVQGGETAAVSVHIAPALRLEIRAAPPPDCADGAELELRLPAGWLESWRFPSRQTASGYEWDALPPGTYAVEMPGGGGACRFAGVRPQKDAGEPRRMFSLAAPFSLLTAVFE